MMPAMSTYMTKKSWVVSFLAVVSLAGSSAVAHADEVDDGKGFVELVLGQMSPLGDDTWDNANGTAGKFGVHGGVWAKRGAGFELGLDYTPLDNVDQSSALGSYHSDLGRVRLLIGGRGGTHVAKHVRLFARVALGADYIRGSVRISTPIGNFDGDDSDVGLGAEIGGGVLLNVFGAFAVGAQIAVPMAFHFTEQDFQKKQYLDAKYNSYDLDLLLTLGTSF